jgi:ATP-binding cassette subfamily B protein
MTVLPLIMVLTTLIGRRTRTGFRRLELELGHINGLMEETISGQRVVQAFRRENTVLADFDTHNLAVRQAGVRAQTFALLMPP